MRHLSVLAAALLCSACATILDHRSQHFSLQSIPDNADFEIREARHGKQVVARGTTPFFVPGSYLVSLRKPGYVSQDVEVRASLNGELLVEHPMALILTPWPVVGMLIVDPATGAMWELDVPTAFTLPKEPAPTQPDGLRQMSE
jgi:hypothetical protein